jgi:hypothetical protein
MMPVHQDAMTFSKSYDVMLRQRFLLPKHLDVACAEILSRQKNGGSG